MLETFAQIEVRLLLYSVLFCIHFPSSVCSMAGEIVYADLNILGVSSRPSLPSQQLNHPPCPRWHRLALQLGAAGILVMAGAVLGMGIWVFQPRESQNHLENNSTGERDIPQCNGSPGLTDFQSRLKQFVCESSPSDSAEGPGCKLCPPDWLLHRDKCYWLCKTKMSWHKSRDDCSKRGARLPVIRDQVEMTFIQTTFKDTNEVWLGLVITPPSRNWTWTDGSLFNLTLPKVENPPKGNNCGVIKANGINFEGCIAASTCICEKAALQI